MLTPYQSDLSCRDVPLLPRSHMCPHRLNYAPHPARPWQVEHVFMTMVGTMIVSGMIAGGVAMSSRVRCQTGCCSRESSAQTDLFCMVTAIDALELDCNRELAEQDGLTALITAPPDGACNWHGPYLRREFPPIDPWGNPYVYRSPTSGPRRLLSLGRDGKERTADDIVVTLDRYVPSVGDSQRCPLTR